MTQTESRKPEEQAIPGQRKSATESKAPVRSSFFKYYIHDSVDACRLQLIGDLSEAEVPELSGCWATAKTTLASRKVLLDLRKLATVDDLGKQWIISMASEGALLLPESFLRDGLAGHGERPKDGATANFFTRCLSFVRGSRTVPAQSSTPAP